MSPPRVEQLQYDMVPLVENEAVEALPESSAFVLGRFRCRCEGRALLAEPLDDFPTPDEARDALEPLLRDWEAEFDIEGLPLEFRFASARVSRPQPDVHTAITAVDFALAHEQAQVLKKIPMHGPSGRVRDTPVVMLIRHRWLSRARRTFESAPAAAYALLTFVIEHFGGDEASAAHRLRVSRKLLEAMRRLSSKSDPARGRKVTSRRETLSDAEIAWLEKAVQIIGLRAAEVDSGTSSVNAITLTDHPLP